MLYKLIPSLVFIGSLSFLSYAVNRTPFLPFIAIYSVSFFSFWWLITKSGFSFRQFFLLALLIRLVILFSVPLLSQDYFRFIWDGILLNLGQNPYAFTPNQLIENQLIAFTHQEALADGMGELSAMHYSNYPPLNQILFFIATFLGGKSIFWLVVWMRLIIISAEVGIILVAKKLLGKMQLPVTSIFWYALNPLVILELNANLHMEPVMLFFFLASIYCLTKQSLIWASIFFSASVVSKLFTLFLLPFFLFFMTVKGAKITFQSFFQPRFLAFVFLNLMLILVSFLAFGWLNHASNYLASVGLWFGTFEFNASVYYIFRWLGYQFVGWNAIAVITKLLLGFLANGYFWLLIKTKSISKQFIFTQMLWATCLYFVLSSTVHPWYLATPILLGVFTRFRFVQVWSYTVMFSYAAYASVKVDEPTLLLWLEYALVALFLLAELRFADSPAYGKQNSYNKP